MLVPNAKQKADCARKRKFASETEAILKSPAGQEPYRCPICRHWHVTTGLVGRVIKAAKQGSEAEKHGFRRAKRRHERGRSWHDNISE